MAEKTAKNPKGAGRKPGSRNKSKLMQAQNKLDDLAAVGIETLEALLKNDKDYLKTKEDVTNALRFQVAKIVIDKAVANEKDKLAEDIITNAKAVKSGPKVFSTAKSKKTG